LVHFLEMPAFLVTLAGMFFARGLAFWVSPLPTPIDHPGLEWLSDELGFFLTLPGAGRAWVPPTALLFLLVLFMAALAFKYTRFGRNMLAIGGDPDSSRLMGLPVGFTRIVGYSLCGLCVGLAGFCTVLTDTAGKPNIGVGLELDAIAAVVIGGTRLTGGIGSVFGTLLGVLIIGLVRAIIIFDGRLPSPWQHITVGGLLLLFITLQRVLGRLETAS
jgi:simple sugar transport system permease protein